MRIDHIAIWCDDIETMRMFYIIYFNCVSNEKYHNQKRGYTSYFLSFPKGGCRIELMNRPDVIEEPSVRGFSKGIAHLAIEVGDEMKVDKMTERFRKDGYLIAGEPRRTGDGYYEAVILDPEGNPIEISAKY